MEQLQSHIWLKASSSMVKYFRISSYIRKPFLIYDFATAPLWISLYMKTILFSFLSVPPSHDISFYSYVSHVFGISCHLDLSCRLMSSPLTICLFFLPLGFSCSLMGSNVVHWLPYCLYGHFCILIASWPLLFILSPSSWGLSYVSERLSCPGRPMYSLLRSTV